MAMLLRPVPYCPKEMGNEVGVSDAFPSLMLNFVSVPPYQIYGPDQNLDRIEECGPYLLCIRPPTPRNKYFYIIRLYHKGTKEPEVVIAVDPPVKLYMDGEPMSYPPMFGICWWIVPERDSFFTMYNGRLICRWGGEMVLKQLPYVRGQQAMM